MLYPLPDEPMPKRAISSPAGGRLTEEIASMTSEVRLHAATSAKNRRLRIPEMKNADKREICRGEAFGTNVDSPRSLSNMERFP